MLKEQTFGIEIEMTGITRNQAAKAVANFFGTTAVHVGGGYDKYAIRDGQGREWKIVFDSSIHAERKVSGRWQSISERGSVYKVEFVSPVLNYDDIQMVQELIRRLRAAGAKVNSSCGLHIHVGKDKHSAKSLRNLINIMASKEDLVYAALQINPNRAGHWCKKLEADLVDRVNKKKPSDLEELASEWYMGYGRGGHYNSSRYHGLNLHNVWYAQTVEFRLFNATLHAGEVKAYIQFCLAVSAQAIQQRSASAKKTETTNPKFTFRTWLLRLGLIGEEFETCRLHMMRHLEGNAAWRYAA